MTWSRLRERLLADIPEPDAVARQRTSLNAVTVPQGKSDLLLHFESFDADDRVRAPSGTVSVQVIEEIVDPKGGVPTCGTPNELRIYRETVAATEIRVGVPTKLNLPAAGRYVLRFSATDGVGGDRVRCYSRTIA